MTFVHGYQVVNDLFLIPGASTSGDESLHTRRCSRQKDLLPLPQRPVPLYDV